METHLAKLSNTYSHSYYLVYAREDQKILEEMLPQFITDYKYQCTTTGFNRLMRELMSTYLPAAHKLYNCIDETYSALAFTSDSELLTPVLDALKEVNEFLIMLFYPYTQRVMTSNPSTSLHTEHGNVTALEQELATIAILIKQFLHYIEHISLFLSTYLDAVTLQNDAWDTLLTCRDELGIFSHIQQQFPGEISLLREQLLDPANLLTLN